MVQTLWKLTFSLFVISHVLSNDTSKEHKKHMGDYGYCESGDNAMPYCSEKDENELVSLDPVAVGHIQEIEAAGQMFQLETLALKPTVFSIDNFLTADEVRHIIKLAEQAGLSNSETNSFKSAASGISLMDVNRDKLLSVSEMILTIEDSFDLYLSEDDILEMYNEYDVDKNTDLMLTPEEIQRFDLGDFRRYISRMQKKHPNKMSRQSSQAWLFPDQSDDAVFQQIQTKVQELTKLSTPLIKHSDFQIVKYSMDGHYNAHYDSTPVEPEHPCCHRGEVPMPCQLCRFMTVLFYLNDVAGGGETAFPVADNQTFNIDEFRLKHEINLQQHCDKANLRVKPQQGRAVLWYNHKVDKDTHWLGLHDDYSYHGGCPVTKGEKWIANFWIKAIDKLKPNNA